MRFLMDIENISVDSIDYLLKEIKDNRQDNKQCCIPKALNCIDDLIQDMEFQYVCILLGYNLKNYDIVLNGINTLQEMVQDMDNVLSKLGYRVIKKASRQLDK